MNIVVDPGAPERCGRKAKIIHILVQPFDGKVSRQPVPTPKRKANAIPKRTPLTPIKFLQATGSA
jgi:hypothetical protein